MTDRVALFLPDLRGGGAERVTLNLAGGLAERGLAVDLVLARAAGTFLHHVPADVRVIDLGANRVLTSLPGLTAYLRQRRPVGLLAVLQHTGTVAVWARYLAQVETRLVVAVHGVATTDARGTWDAKERLASWPMGWFCARADALVTVSEGAAHDLARVTPKGTEKIHVIYNPVITPALFEQARQPLPHPWFASDSPPVVVALGRLVPQKDYPTLLRAFALLRETTAARLMILGEGPDRAQLERLAVELGVHAEIALPGFVDNPYPYVARAGVLASSSVWEALPTVLIEALALGTPVVATDCAYGPAEILGRGAYGSLVPPGDPDRLAGALKRTLARGERCSTDPRHLARFSLSSAVDRYLEVLRPPALGDGQGADG